VTAAPDGDAGVVEVLQRRGVTRLLHFTPARNLPHILRDRRLRAVKELAEDVRAVYANTDPQRLDGQTDKISCSIEFPNGWYLRRVKGKTVNYPDWVYLVLDPLVAARPGALFCYRNAASGYGDRLKAGQSGLEECYAPSVVGAYDRTYRRGPHHSPAAPTDAQAEVLVPGPIDLSHIRAIIHPSPAHAAQEWARLGRLGLDPSVVEWASSPTLFDANATSNAAQSGGVIEITSWVFGGTP
jgi:hypothetical protein